MRETLLRTVRVSLAAAAMSVYIAAASAQEESAESPSGQPPSVVCLRTEYLPIDDKAIKGLLKYRLVRELGRQAVLIAARDELGLATRDETLGEPFPESVTQAKQDFHAKVRGFIDGHVRVDVWPASVEASTEPDTHQLGEFSGDAIVILTDKLEEMSRGELLDKLRSAGLTGEAETANEDNLPPEAVENQLLEMNFVSQFAAVRAAHAAIAAKGQSRAWLGVLARGYAHLALMTEHHWKSDNEAFAARALLYVERLATANADDPLSRTHRAYVRAIVGMHGAALVELDTVEKLQAKSGNAAPLPGWCDLIRPYCSFEREPVMSLGDRRASLRQLAQRLSFEQQRAFGDERWLFDSARKTMSICPDEYGVYAALAVPGAPLAVGRTGAYYAPAALARFLPARISALPDLPKPVRDVVGAEVATESTEEDDAGAEGDADGESDAEDAENESDNNQVPAVEVDPEENYESPIPAIVRALREATVKGDDRGEPSWSALGEVILEEQFVQAANYLNISLNATESSQAEAVEAILPALDGHRYINLIKSYAVNSQRESTRLYEIIGDMKLVDPRGNMQSMMWRTWRAPAENGRNSLGSDAAFYAYYDLGLTLPGMMEAYDRLASVWWSSTDAYFRKRWLDAYRAVSPHAPQTLRLTIEMTEDRPHEQIVEWESEAGEDPTVFITLARLYIGLENYEDAIRCFERSIELSPRKEAFVGLASAYRDSGQEELWQPTLERFFEVEALGLEHASVHQIIANDFIDKGKWQEAESHALEAANTWSAWGLELAADVYEGLGQLEESEKWIREMSANYPSSSGYQWYFWCRRHGRGDSDAALKLAEMYFSPTWMRTNDEARSMLFTFNYLKNDLPSALDDAKYLFDRYSQESATLQNRAFFHMQLLLLAREMKDERVEKQAMDSIRTTWQSLREPDSDLGAIVEFECKLLDGEKIEDGTRDEVDKHLASAALPEMRRSNHEYIVGRAYELRGEVEPAKEYYKRAIRSFRVNPEISCIAGMRLADLGEETPAAEETVEQ